MMDTTVSGACESGGVRNGLDSGMGIGRAVTNLTRHYLKKCSSAIKLSRQSNNE